MGTPCRHRVSDCGVCSKRIIPNGPEGAITPVREVEANGAALLAAACERGLEASPPETRPVLSIRPRRRLGQDQMHQSSCVRCRWLRAFVVRSSGIGALLLAARRAVQPGHVGSVGTGFKEAAVWKLREQLDKLVTKKPAVNCSGRRKGCHLVPRLFPPKSSTGLGHDGKPQACLVQGLRDAADVADVYEIG